VEPTPANTGGPATATDNCAGAIDILYSTTRTPVPGWYEEFDAYVLGSQLHGQGWQAGHVARGERAK